MANAMLQLLRNLYEQELYSNVIHLGGLLCTACDRFAVDSEAVTAQQKYQIYVLYADALATANCHKKSEQTLMKALQLRRSLFRGQSDGVATRSQQQAAVLSPSNSTTDSLDNENEVKHRLCQSLIRQQKYQEAVGVLESVPPKARSAKIHMTLAGLYQQLSMTKLARDCYKDVLRECPLAIEAAVRLLQLGATLDEVTHFVFPPAAPILSSLRTKQLSPVQNAVQSPMLVWLPLWLKGQAAMAAKDYAEAVRCFKELDSASLIANNVRLLSDLGKAYYAGGENAKAIAVLQRVNSLDALHFEGMEILAALLFEEKRIKELESLATRLMSDDDKVPQSLIAMGYLCRALKKPTQALHLSHKACSLGNGPQPNVDALLLKGLILLESKKYTEAALHFSEGLAVAPHRFELHEGLVHCCLERQKTKEALAAAQTCYKQVGPFARPLTLYASVLAKDPSLLDKAQSLLERAVSSAPHLLSAVYLLVDIYNTQGKVEPAICLLRKQANIHVKSKLHQMLGDLLSKANKHSEALDRYRFALSLDPDNAQAMNGLSSLEDSKGASSAAGEDAAFLSPADVMPAVPPVPDAPRHVAGGGRGPNARLFANNNDNDDINFNAGAFEGYR